MHGGAILCVWNCRLNENRRLCGETYIVLPTEAFSDYIGHPLVRRLYLTDAGFFPHAAHYRERSGIEEYIFLCCTSGRGVVEVQGRTFPLRDNEALCIPPPLPAPLLGRRGGPLEPALGAFPGRGLRLLPAGPAAGLPVFVGGTVRRMEFLFNQLFRTLEQDLQLEHFIYLSQLLALILGETYTRRQEDGTTARQNRQVTRAVRYMYRHLDRELTLAELSAAMGTSPSTLSAVFRQCTGHAPMDFFTRLKMKQACRMLRSGGEYVYEVARQLGYRDPYYFSRAFKKVMGVSPRSYQNGLGRSDPPGDEET